MCTEWISMQSKCTNCINTKASAQEGQGACVCVCPPSTPLNQLSRVPTCIAYPCTALCFGYKGSNGMGSKGGRGSNCGGTLLPLMENPAYTHVKARQNTQLIITNRSVKTWNCIKNQQVYYSNSIVSALCTWTFLKLLIFNMATKQATC